MTAEYVAFHATVHPDAVAIVDNGREVTYGEFARSIRKCVGALREFGLAPGSSVAIACEDFYLEWLLRLACEELSLVTARFVAPDTPGAQVRLQQFDLVLSSRALATDKVRRQGATTSEWLREILEHPDPGEAPVSAKRDDDALSIVYTSGTTGTPKRILITRGIFKRRVEKLMWFMELTPASRYLLAAGSATRTHAAFIWVGATVVIESRMPVPEAIATHGITHVTLPPNALRGVLDTLPSGFSKPPKLTVLSFGAPASRALREEALDKLATDVCDLYGSNEIGFISSRRGTAEFGSLWPGVRIEIIDDRHEAVPNGGTGWIRIKTDCMATGYVDDPTTTARTFDGGWFHTQDLGVLRGHGRLQVIGRGDDVLNIGGVKLAPTALEDLVLTFVPTADAGICSLTNPDAIEEICVVLSGPRCGDQEILAGLGRAFAGHQIGKFYVLKMDRIPRNANGKILRAELKELAGRAMRSM